MMWCTTPNSPGDHPRCFTLIDVCLLGRTWYLSMEAVLSFVLILEAVPSASCSERQRKHMSFGFLQQTPSLVYFKYNFAFIEIC